MVAAQVPGLTMECWYPRAWQPRSLEEHQRRYLAAIDQIVAIRLTETPPENFFDFDIGVRLIITRDLIDGRLYIHFSASFDRPLLDVVRQAITQEDRGTVRARFEQMALGLASAISGIAVARFTKCWLSNAGVPNWIAEVGS